MAKCQGCGAEIDWVKLTSGTTMPVNPGYVEIDITGPKTTTIVSDDGRVHSGGQIETLSLFPVPTIRGRVSHFATCPKGSLFRRY